MIADSALEYHPLIPPYVGGEVFSMPLLRMGEGIVVDKNPSEAGQVSALHLHLQL